ncbi:MAG TPA: PadR family transcriptional regulator [Steroidobacteraceae bacterium]|nr:PadR family transcriptional regulator [Steroidobacteraceae bacterium]
MENGSPVSEPNADSLSRKFQRELSAGLTSLVLLALLADADRDMYGYEIAKRLGASGNATAPFKQGALYPVLRNLSAAGLLSSRVVPSYAGPPRRYYRITQLGRATLEQWQDLWFSTRAFVDSIVKPPILQAATQ